MSEYWRTCDEDGVTTTHLSHAGDFAICGHDLIGDDLVHSKAPKKIESKTRITCPHCLQIIEVVKEHLKK